MSASGVELWRAYAATLPQVSKKGAKITLQPINAFCALADKFLLVSPGGTVPMTPPTAGFPGDSLSFTVAPGTGSVRFTVGAGQATSSNVRVELLLQPLKGKNRKPSADGYLSQKFVSFDAGGPTASVAVPAGWYAAAVKQVNVLTGQQTPLMPLGVVTVAFALEDGGAGEGDARMAA